MRDNGKENGSYYLGFTGAPKVGNIIAPKSLKQAQKAHLIILCAFGIQVPP